ncbi:MAG TPA: TIGR03943 family protein [Chthoniobacteraceae bacterium]|nr:TIGR03943 family protein [Chthoniobacteraceae bacterium]
MNKLFNRWLPCVTLAAWSAVLLVFHFNGRVKDFLAPTFRPYVPIAGVILGLMALIFLLFRADASCCSSAECGHSLSRLATGKILTFLILLVPLTVAATFSPDSFGKTAIENRGITEDYASLGIGRPKSLAPVDMPLPTNDPTPPAGTPGDSTQSNQQPPAPEPAATDYLVRTPDGNIVAEVLDLLYAAQDNVLRKDFEGKRVQLIGQLMPDKTSAAQGARFKAVRMFMYCCAADSRPVATLVETDKMPDLPEMTWVKIIGTPTFPVENGRRVSVLKAEKIEKTDPPEEATLY